MRSVSTYNTAEDVIMGQKKSSYVNRSIPQTNQNLQNSTNEYIILYYVIFWGFETQIYQKLKVITTDFHQSNLSVAEKKLSRLQVDLNLQQSNNISNYSSRNL